MRQLTEFKQAALRARALRENGESAAARLLEAKWRERPGYDEAAWRKREAAGWQ